ncbi:MAG: BLUF domain-containing protein [Sphingopyxis sp.]|uniref:BLUF domain-containing protein n=1 Tax=Sphingopyxis sp. TaxID=1908224 RepID=UPI002AB8455B|nr:BLUF domain-containing protein [Sphingopyxis sp.]MDZ3833595.1 BLUF domain-containing protein [Sphingopyxis sp.]
MLSIIYVSVADPLLGTDDITKLVEQAQRNNARDELTGALIYNGHNFMQLLEGPSAKVEACLGLIRPDRRHSGMVEIRRRHVSEREFSGWSMLYHRLHGDVEADLSRLAANGKLDEQDERLMANFIALGARRGAG